MRVCIVVTILAPSFKYSFVYLVIMLYAHGCPFAQLIHDGGTLANGEKSQALALLTIDPEWDGSRILCIDFEHSTQNTATEVAKLVTTSIAAICATDSNTTEKEMTYSNVLKSSIQDGATTKVTEELGIPRVTCAMHQLDKVPRYATGTKVRTKGGVSQCEFPE
jgi:hypothetical protein